VNHTPARDRISGGDKAEKIEQLLEKIFRNRNLKDKNNPVQEDNDPCDQRKPLTENGIFQRDHELKPSSANHFYGLIR
jgi:hypothetical protein